MATCLAGRAAAADAFPAGASGYSGSASAARIAALNKGEGAWRAAKFLGNRSRAVPDRAAVPRAAAVIGVFSSPNAQGRVRRARWRAQCARYGYRKLGLPYRFFVGIPVSQAENPHSHWQATNATALDMRAMALVRKEATTHGDIVVLPLVDMYTRTTLKLIQMLDWLVRRARSRGSPEGSSYVVKLDDDNCLVPSALDAMVARRARGPYIYGGYAAFRRAEYGIQRGHDGSFSPYQSGHGLFLSVSLAAAVLAITDPPLAYYHLEARCSCEDCVLGRWVDRVKAQRNISVQLLEDWGLVRPVDELER